MQHDTLQQCYANSFVLSVPLMLSAFNASATISAVEVAGWLGWLAHWLVETKADMQVGATWQCCTMNTWRASAAQHSIPRCTAELLGCLLEAEFVADCEKEHATYNTQLATYKYNRQHTTHVHIAQKQQFLRDCKKKGEKATAEEKKALKLAVLGYPRWLEYCHVLE